MCNRASYAKFSGLRLDSDFVEIPAQVLENWYVCVYNHWNNVCEGHPSMHRLPNLAKTCLMMKNAFETF